jgi:hypothetical protein
MKRSPEAPKMANFCENEGFVKLVLFNLRSLNLKKLTLLLPLFPQEIRKTKPSLSFPSLPFKNSILHATTPIIPSGKCSAIQY